MGIVPGLVGRCDLVLRTAPAIFALRGRPGRAHVLQCFCGFRSDPAAAGNAPIGTPFGNGGAVLGVTGACSRAYGQV